MIVLFEQNPSICRVKNYDGSTNSAFSSSKGMVCFRVAVGPLRRKNCEGELPRAA
jgi:hypothetical protein